MKTRMLLLCLMGVAVVFSGVVNAADETVASDGFGDGLQSSTGLLDLNWWQVNNSSSYNLTVADDAVGIGAGNALFLENTSGSTTRRLVANFPRTVQLAAPGDYVELNFDLRLTTATSSSNGLRFGLYDSVGTFVTEDLSGTDDTLVDDDLGYMFRIATSGGGSELRLARDRGLGALLGGDDPQTITTDLIYGSIADMLKHDFKFIITVIGAPALGMQWDLYIDDDAKVSPALSGVLYLASLDDEYTKFDEVAFAAYGSGIDFAIDNVEVISNSVLPNTPPSVDAGGYGIMPVNIPYTLSGSYIDDGNPTGGLADDTFKWSAADPLNDLNMVFTDPGDWVLDPNITVLDPGMYAVQLEVNDGDGAIGVEDPNTNGTGSDIFYAHAKDASLFNALQGRWKFDGIDTDPDDYYYNYTTVTGVPAFNEIDEKIGGKCLSLAPGDEIRYGWALGAENSVSVAFWMRPDAAALADTAKGIVSKYPDDGTSKFGGWTVQWRAENTMRFRVNDSWGNGNGDLIVTDPNGFKFDEWVHVAATYDGDTGVQKFYRNGILMAEGDSPHVSFDPHAEFKIGTSNWAGMLDDMYLYDYAIDLAEVRELYTLAGNAAPAVTADDLLVKGTVSVGIPLTASFIDENAAMNSASWVKVDGPGNMVLTNIVIGAGTVTATATFDAVGDYTVYATVTDDGIPAPVMTGASGEFIVKVRTAGFDGLEARFDFESNLANSAGDVTYLPVVGGSPVRTSGAGMSGSYGLVLNGLADYLNYGKYLGAEDAITVMFWVKADAAGLALADQHIVQKWPSDDSMRGWMTRVREADDNFAAMVGSGFNGPGAYVQAPAALKVIAATWTHLAMSFDGTFVNVYQDGVLVNSVDPGGTYSTADIVSPFVIGYRQNNGASYYDGVIDELRVYDSALTQAAIVLIFTADGGTAPVTCISAALSGDFDLNCYVNIDDLKYMAGVWLTADPLADIGPVADDTVNMDDYSEMAQQWLDCVDPTDVDCL